MKKYTIKFKKQPK